MNMLQLIKRLAGFSAVLINQKNNSGFFADFKRNVLKPEKNTALPLVDQYRELLAAKRQVLHTRQWGAGSHLRNAQTIAHKSVNISVDHKTGMLLHNLVKHYQPDVVIELGTAFGISATYMAAGNPHSRIITVEGNPQLFELSKTHFNHSKLFNIHPVQANFDEILDELGNKTTKKSMVFIDGNHTQEATLRYCKHFRNKARIIVFDDIMWSDGMMKAWKTIFKSEKGIKIDLFRTGLLFPLEENQSCAMWY